MMLEMYKNFTLYYRDWIHKVSITEKSKALD